MWPLAPPILRIKWTSNYDYLVVKRDTFSENVPFALKLAKIPNYDLRYFCYHESRGTCPIQHQSRCSLIWAKTRTCCLAPAGLKTKNRIPTGGDYKFPLSTPSVFTSNHFSLLFEESLYDSPLSLDIQVSPFSTSYPQCICAMSFFFFFFYINTRIGLIPWRVSLVT